jgi:hypothetical protein
MAARDGTTADAHGLLAERSFAGDGRERVARSTDAGRNHCSPSARCAESDEILKRTVPSLVDWFADAEN